MPDPEGDARGDAVASDVTPVAEQDGADGGDTLPLFRETAEIGTRERVTGRVRVSTRTETFERELETTLEHERVSITRVEIGRELDPQEPLPEPRTEDGVTVVPVFEEVAVIVKRLVLREELRIERVTDTEDVAVPVALRRQHADVERLPNDENDPSPSSPSPDHENPTS